MSAFQLGLCLVLAVGALASPAVLVLGADIVRSMRLRRASRRAIDEYREETRRYVRAVAPSLRTPVGWDARRVR